MKVRVPATSANLGPGFDSLGLALSLYNEVEFIEAESSSIEDEKYWGSLEDHLTYKSYKYVFDELGEEIIPVTIKIVSSIPPSRGLGSSSACIVSGVVGALSMLGHPLDRDKVLYYSNKIEGHPDNVAPCIHGGLVVSSLDGDDVVSIKLSMGNAYKFLALIPSFELSTSKARSALPTEITLKDGVFNSSRLAVLLASLVEGRDEYLAFGLQDRFHQPYRGSLIPGFEEIMAFVKSTPALGAYLSGAGPTIMVLAKKEDNSTLNLIKDFVSGLEKHWEIVELELDTEGFIVEN